MRQASGRPAAPADVTAAYRVLLGRDAEPAALVEKAGQRMDVIVVGLLTSPEFIDGVLTPLLEGRTPGERFNGLPVEADAGWAIGALALEAETMAALAVAQDWRSLLLALFADTSLSLWLAALDLSWSRSRLLEALEDWSPVRADASTRETDWGESTAERRAAMSRDVAERLALTPPWQVRERPGPLISVLTPVYQSPLEFLARAIDSVRAQTYPRWELILVDDGSAKGTVRSLLEAYAALDGRIRPVFLPANGGIAAASNAGLEVARGDYLALLDHDDMLTRDALEHVADALTARPDADLLYSDECFIGEDDAPQDLFPKPDWSPLLMLNMHYIGHLTVHRTAQVRELGGFRSEFDFSQDYDLALRVAETDPVVVHIDRVLYGWRRIEGSAAAGGKDYARASNVAALQAAVDRRGWGGFAEVLPTANRVRRRPSSPPRVALVIPSDSADNIGAAVRSIFARTWYTNFEVLVVTNSPMAARLRPELADPRLRWIAYDRPFNFSDKCNVGAAAAEAEYVVFFNDDVRVITPDWVDSLLEVATLPGVGAVGCKLLYEDDTLQHAGMVTGVRRLVGTAFHQLPADTHALFNLGAQSVREVSLICGALLMTPRALFLEVGGFDAVEVPVSHSDVDLCLRLRELRLSLVYTPHAVLRHIGHVSIRAENAAPTAPAKPRLKDKSDLHILRRFPEALARDPYFPEAVRGLFYRDGESRFRLHPALPVEALIAPSGRDVLIISHELTLSGAPHLALEMTRTLAAQGDRVVVISALDGPLRDRIRALGAPVIVDTSLFRDDAAIRDFGRNFDVVIANTVVSWPAVRALAPHVELIWYLHEVGLIERVAREQPLLQSVFAMPSEIWAPSRLTLEALKPFGATARMMPGFAADAGLQPPRTDPLVRIGVLGGFERRKGQDLALEAWALLPADLRNGAELLFWGRVLEPDFHAALLERSEALEGARIEGELSHHEALAAVRDCDVVLVSSRDDPLPLVSLDALAAGRVLACSRRVGTADFLEPGVSGLVCEAPQPLQLAALMAEAIAYPDLRARLGQGGRAVFEREFTHEAFERRMLEAAQRVAAR